MSATPGPYERQHSTRIAEQIIRPTGLIDPEIVIRPTKGQIDDLISEIKKRTEAGERVIVTTLTKKMSEILTEYLVEIGTKVQYLHSEIHTLERTEIFARFAPRCVRRGRWNQPAPRGFGLARSIARRYSGRRQGRLFAVGNVAYPNYRACRA